MITLLDLGVRTNCFVRSAQEADFRSPSALYALLGPEMEVRYQEIEVAMCWLKLFCKRMMEVEWQPLQVTRRRGHWVS